jgi:hypothetical protein
MCLSRSRNGLRVTERDFFLLWLVDMPYPQVHNAISSVAKALSSLS